MKGANVDGGMWTFIKKDSEEIRRKLLEPFDGLPSADGYLEISKSQVPLAFNLNFNFQKHIMLRIIGMVILLELNGHISWANRVGLAETCFLIDSQIETFQPKCSSLKLLVAVPILI